ncbi:hypothetical protein HMPREF0208_04224 [Citrobacter koseri]|nr:hypothetical protein HMPREF3220_00748 [Citrobacter koseri]KXA04723.1 hypothetical protein HMPREF3207_01196 [Citrobacter koseri]KXB40528.1 hypothetical protein HMPREF0208_04224 [Citrobacter koseri]
MSDCRIYASCHSGVMPDGAALIGPTLCGKVKRLKHPLVYIVTAVVKQ